MSKYCGSKIKELRKERGLTVAELAKTIRLSELYMKKIENGERQPVPAKLLNIARVLEVSVSFLLDDTEQVSSLPVKHYEYKRINEKSN